MCTGLHFYVFVIFITTALSEKNEKSRNNHTDWTVQKYNRKIVERHRIDTLTHQYMAAQFPALVHIFQ